MRIFPGAASTAAAFLSLLISLAQPGTGGAAAPRTDAPPLPPLPPPLNLLFGGESSSPEATPAASSSSPSEVRPAGATTARYAPGLQQSIVAEINVVRKRRRRLRRPERCHRRRRVRAPAVTENCMRPAVPGDESAALPPAQFRALVAELIRERTLHEHRKPSTAEGRR